MNTIPEVKYTPGACMVLSSVSGALTAEQLENFGDKENLTEFRANSDFWHTMADFDCFDYHPENLDYERLKPFADFFRHLLQIRQSIDDIFSYCFYNNELKPPDLRTLEVILNLQENAEHCAFSVDENELEKGEK